MTCGLDAIPSLCREVWFSARPTCGPVWDLDTRADKAVWSAQHFRIFGFEPSSRTFDQMSFVALVHRELRESPSAD
jgi:hypothetical protein